MGISLESMSAEFESGQDLFGNVFKCEEFSPKRMWLETLEGKFGQTGHVPDKAKWWDRTYHKNCLPQLNSCREAMLFTVNICTQYFIWVETLRTTLLAVMKWLNLTFVIVYSYSLLIFLMIILLMYSDMTTINENPGNFQTAWKEYLFSVDHYCKRELSF